MKTEKNYLPVFFGILIFTFFPNVYLIAQSVGVNVEEPHESALMELKSTEKGFLPPRMSSTQRDDIENPAPGLRIYNTDTNCENFFNGTAWHELCGTCTPEPSEANAGEDQLSIRTETVTLEANDPEFGTGEWEIVSGDLGEADGFDDINVHNTTFEGQEHVEYTLRWTITTPCGSSSDEVDIYFKPCPDWDIGDFVDDAGGYVVYRDAANPNLGECGYLIAAGSDISGTKQWGCQKSVSDLIPDADGEAIGDGYGNSVAILEFHDDADNFTDCSDYYDQGCPDYCDSNNDGTVAAKGCLEYSVEVDGVTFEDWFLPSLDELEKLCENLHNQSTGGFSSDFYWSSYSGHGNTAGTVEFNASCTKRTGGNEGNKSNERQVRCVRVY